MDKRAVLYARCSGDDRGNDGRNLDSQLELAREYATSKGYQIVAEIAEDDKGASGAAFELPGLNQIREMAAAGDFDVLIPRELDRLSRNLAKQLIVEEQLTRAGVGIEYALAEYADTPEGRLQKHIKATVAEYEREKITERVTRGRFNKIRAGHVIVHGHPPYGYAVGQVDGKTALVIIKSEARVVRSIFNWYVFGDETEKPLTLRRIALKLSGTPTHADLYGKQGKTRPFGTWSTSCISKMLGNTTYAGDWTYGKVNRTTRTVNPPEHVLTVQVPAIVSREVFDAAQDRLRTNKAFATRNTKYDYLMARRLTCGRCGCKMGGVVNHSSSKPILLYYRCHTGGPHWLAQYDHLCDMPHFRTDQVDAAVWDWVRQLLKDPQALDRGIEDFQAAFDQSLAPARERAEIVDELLADNRKQLERLLDLYLTGDFPRDVLTDRKVRLETTIRALERERVGLSAQLEKRAFTPGQIDTLRDFAARAARGVARAEIDFGERRGLINDLDVQARLAVEGDQRIAYVSCIVHPDKQRLIVSTGGNSAGHNTQLLTLSARLILGEYKPIRRKAQAVEVAA